MSLAYRYGPWVGLLTVSALVFVGLQLVSGDDPISVGLISIGRWLVGALTVLLAVGLCFEFRSASRRAD